MTGQNDAMIHDHPDLVRAIMNEIDMGRQQDDDLIEQVLDVMKGLGIKRVSYSLNGGGDDGDCYLEEILMADDSVLPELPKVPVTFTSGGHPIDLDDYLNEHASEAPDGNWCDNEGGSGNVTYHPFADGVDQERVEVDMTYGDDEDYDGEDDDLDDVHLGDEDDDADDDEGEDEENDR